MLYENLLMNMHHENLLMNLHRLVNSVRDANTRLFQYLANSFFSSFLH